jgi:hypothetical protein
MTSPSSAFKPSVVIAIVVYSLIFPLTQLMGESFVVVGFLVTLPFVPIAYICGMVTAVTFGSETGYIFGFSLAVLAQVVLVVVVRHARAQKKSATVVDPY